MKCCAQIIRHFWCELDCERKIKLPVNMNAKIKISSTMLAMISLFLAIAPSQALMLSARVPGGQQSYPQTGSPWRTRSIKMETLTITIAGCKNGIGVGLDPMNVVDLLRPGMPAEKQLKIGDVVTHWDGAPLFKVEGGRQIQVKLIEVAPDPLVDSYILTVERKREWSQSVNGSTPPSWEQKSW